MHVYPHLHTQTPAWAAAFVELAYRRMQHYRYRYRLCFCGPCRISNPTPPPQVDFLIVVSSLLEIVLMTITSSVGAVSALRVLRAFKPLRLLTRSAGMRLVFKSVTMSLMSMANVSVVCLLFFLIFAILGVQLFSGRFYGWVRGSW